MKKTLYTAAETAEILGLHQKTVQRFIREGKINATKIGRAWKIHIDDLKEYSHAELLQNEKPGFKGGYPISSDTPLDERVSVSAVMELREATEREVSRISNTLIAVLNCKDPSWGKARYDFIYDPDTGTARFVLYGNPVFISSIMKLLEPLISEKEN